MKSKKIILKIALPKGRLWESVEELLKFSEIQIKNQHRNYKPSSNLKNIQFYVVKPRNIPELVESGLVDIGIVGQDMVLDENSDVDILLDLKMMPVFIVFASNNTKVYNQQQKSIVVATEYANIAKRYLSKRKIHFKILKTYGSTECFVPEFADAIIDHTQTGETLRANNLKVQDIILKSTTCLIANKKSSKKPEKILEMRRFCEMISKGLRKVDTKYAGFLTEKQIMEEFT